MMKRTILVIIMIISFVGIYSFKSNNGETGSGYASYYHDKFNGRKTASGEIFNNNDLTAAHKKLPFGTLVEITNLRTGKSVVVRVNDRGPYVKGRSFDLSKAAYNAIGDHRRGTMPITYKVLSEDEI
ncbi:septal ring lytic transglycosylase RlpA family protein [Riemerella anatipestifer]|uniref:septal ring lytic transglycosylase RlpA family protein n=1 Tax=Riemerella anatipestifer TaxID=34085 RepID=UPI00129DAA05|nr:septal ring lytic transglycosylase RlpA family protein [Riemerella anatipestifer]MRM83703.1 septal ring lytic transglycosylase RlpA family protein [Riemerella anatipestifer]